MNRSVGGTTASVDGVDPHLQVGYLEVSATYLPSMKTSFSARLALASFIGGLLLLSAGCASHQQSGGAPIAPNWYDSAFSKDGRLLVPTLPENPPVANP
jgi:hypothetical protein